MTKAGSTPSAHEAPVPDEELLETIGVAFSQLRRRTMEVPVDPPVAATDLRRDLALTAIEISAHGLTVSELADALSLDRSAASRLASWCVERGLLLRAASQTDGRSITLHLTSQGRQVLRHSRHQQRQAFEYITRDWSRSDRVQFARLLHRYAAAGRALAPKQTS